MDTEAGDIEYEIARYRNRLDRDFFASLNTEIGTIRIKTVRTAKEDERLAELEILRDALEEGADAFDKMKEDVRFWKGTYTESPSFASAIHSCDNV